MTLATAFGLGIQSAFPLPELAAGAERVDVSIRLGKLGPPPLEQPPRAYFYQITEDEAYLYWERAGAFHIRGGREIVVDPAPGAEERVLRLYLLGSVMAALLHMRGRLVLHASGVAMGRGVTAFLGSSGQGKSTIAAALHQCGYPLVADDVVALAPFTAPNEPMVTPGFPRMKLWPDTLRALGKDPEPLSKVHPLEEKRSYAAADGFTLQEIPLCRVYVLTEGPRCGIERLGPQEALVELIRHTARMELFPSAKAPVHLRQCADLINHVSVYRLTRPHSFDHLSEVASLVQAEQYAVPTAG